MRGRRVTLPANFLSADCGNAFSITVSIPEDSDVEGTVTILETSDQDRDKNGKFECSMEDMDLQTMDTFSVRRIPEGCALVLRSFLDWSTANQYSFTVRATDQADAAQRKSAVATGKQAFSFSSSVINTCGVLLLLSNFKFDAVVFTTTKVPLTCWSRFTKARLGES